MDQNSACKRLHMKLIETKPVSPQEQHALRRPIYCVLNMCAICGCVKNQTFGARTPMLLPYNTLDVATEDPNAIGYFKSSQKKLEVLKILAYKWCSWSHFDQHNHTMSAALL